jgi:hypothetical protein
MSPLDLELLKDADPVDREEARERPIPVARLEAITTNEAAARRSTGGFPRRRRALAAGVCLAAVVAITTAILPGGGSTGGEAPSGAEGLLTRAASIAQAAAADQPSAASGFAYSKVEVRYLAITADRPSFSTMRPRIVESWLAPDGSGRTRETDKPEEFVGPGDERNYHLQGDPYPLAQGGAVRTDDFAPGEAESAIDVAVSTDLPAISELLTDPDELETELVDAARADAGPAPRDDTMFEFVGTLLIQSGSSAELQAALYEVASRIDNVEIEPDTKDPLGRRSVAVSHLESGGRQNVRSILYFDPDTSQPLATTKRLTEDLGYVDGRVIGSLVLLDSGEVSSIGERPK